jgi:DNA-binding FrmR family transcriptional regulator
MAEGQNKGYRNGADHTARLQKIAGQVRGIARMIETGAPIIDVATQLSAVNGAVRAVGLGLLAEKIPAADLAEVAKRLMR